MKLSQNGRSVGLAKILESFLGASGNVLMIFSQFVQIPLLRLFYTQLELRAVTYANFGWFLSKVLKP